MKKALTILFLASTIFFCNQAVAQSFKGYYKNSSLNRAKAPKGLALEIGVQTNRSIRGWRNGYHVDLALSNKFRIGYFNTTGRADAENSKRSDNGAEMSFMFNSKGNLSFGPQVKVTVTDERFVSVIPMLQTRLSLTERLMVKAGAGMSDRYPIFDGGLSFLLN